MDRPSPSLQLSSRAAGLLALASPRNKELVPRQGAGRTRSRAIRVLTPNGLKPRMDTVKRIRKRFYSCAFTVHFFWTCGPESRRSAFLPSEEAMHGRDALLALPPMRNQNLRSSYDGMNRIFWNRANSRSSISSVSTHSWNPKRRALVVSDITS